mmetsp:Transcript_32582/g.54642  ORF Transcript_32582/g.54642 Transcript_32582/m.54642 type:complete len:337 (+) Transcript_32582:128-1138(+)
MILRCLYFLFWPQLPALMYRSQNSLTPTLLVAAASMDTPPPRVFRTHLLTATKKPRQQTATYITTNYAASPSTPASNRGASSTTLPSPRGEEEEAPGRDHRGAPLRDHHHDGPRHRRPPLHAHRCGHLHDHLRRGRHRRPNGRCPLEEGERPRSVAHVAPNGHHHHHRRHHGRRRRPSGRHPRGKRRRRGDAPRGDAPRGRGAASGHHQHLHSQREPPRDAQQRGALSAPLRAPPAPPPPPPSAHHAPGGLSRPGGRGWLAPRPPSCPSPPAPPGACPPPPCGCAPPPPPSGAAGTPSCAPSRARSCGTRGAPPGAPAAPRHAAQTPPPCATSPAP